MAKKVELNPNDLLQKEYEYIAQTVFQANEDRSRFTSFYLVSTGSLVAAITGTQLEGASPATSFAFFILFVVLTSMGALTIAQLARLRNAWHESVTAMNQIKDFFMEKHPEIQEAFRWKTENMPKTNKPGSIANLIVQEVTILSALTTGASLYFLFSYAGEITIVNWALIILGTLGTGFSLWAWYIHLLDKKG